MHLIKIGGFYVSEKINEEIDKEIIKQLKNSEISKKISLELMKNRFSYETKEKNNS